MKRATGEEELDEKISELMGGRRGKKQAELGEKTEQEETEEDKQTEEVGGKIKDNDHPPLKAETTEDAMAIAAHYNSRPEMGKHHRRASRVIRLRKFNNWIKSVLIDQYAGRVGALVAMDLGCGKGGDLEKWRQAPLEKLFGVDIAKVSVEHARQRYESMRPKAQFSAEFFNFDAFHVQMRKSSSFTLAVGLSRRVGTATGQAV